MNIRIACISLKNFIVFLLTLFKPLIQYTKGCVGRFMQPHYLKTIANACSKLRIKNKNIQTI